MSDEVKKLEEELAIVRAQLLALERLLSTNEHLLLKSPYLEVIHQLWGPPADWNFPARELWTTRFSLLRTDVRSGHSVTQEWHANDRRVDVFSQPRVMLVALPWSKT